MNCLTTKPKNLIFYGWRTLGKHQFYLFLIFQTFFFCSFCSNIFRSLFFHSLYFYSFAICSSIQNTYALYCISTYVISHSLSFSIISLLSFHKLMIQRWRTTKYQFKAVEWDVFDWDKHHSSLDEDFVGYRMGKNRSYMSAESIE